MIVRILGESQYEVPDTEVATLNGLDDAVQKAVEAGAEDAFRDALSALVERVRATGTKLADDALSPSDAVLPPADASLSEVAETLHEEGLIPG